MIELPFNFLMRMRSQLGADYSAFVSSYDRAPYRGIRVNSSKISAGQFKKISPFALEEVPWEEDGFYVDEEKAGKTVLHAAGLYYVQEPSAMSAAPLLEVKGGERVLDLCSAPGGKGTQLAQKMGGKGVIVLNEINFSRAKILSQNVERLGVTNAAVISASPEALEQPFCGYFDKVLVDAPCSGEGMFLKEPNAVREWSAQNVEACARRQTQILSSAAKVLKNGGLLVYSTCTFAPQEDELQVEEFLKNNGQFKLLSMKKLLPHECRGEGHFVALLRKCGGEESATPPFKCEFKDGKLLSAYRGFESRYLKKTFENLHLAGNTLYSIPQACPSLPFKVLRAGVRLGEFLGDRFEPSHSLAMCLKKEEAESVEVDGDTALLYIGGRTFDCPMQLSGWALVTYMGFPLGWCKCVNGTAKNHLPKGLRI